MLRENSIQARFGGVRLPTAIHQNNKILANLSDFVTMKKHMGNTINGGDHSVIEFEINAVGDSGVHQTFDLTHGSFVVDLISMGQDGGKVNRPRPLRQLAHSDGLGILQSVVCTFCNLVNERQRLAGIVDQNLFATVSIPIGRGDIGILNNTHHDSCNGGNVEQQSVNERLEEFGVH